VRPHWSYLGWPLVATVAAALLTGAVLGFLTGAPIELASATLVLVALAALWLGGRWLRWASTTFAVTSERVVMRRGVVIRRLDEVPIYRIDALRARQGLLERVLGTGTLLIDSAGSEGTVSFERVPHPVVVRQIVDRQLQVMRRRGVYDQARPIDVWGAPVAAGYSGPGTYVAPGQGPVAAPGQGPVAVPGQGYAPAPLQAEAPGSQDAIYIARPSSVVDTGPQWLGVPEQIERLADLHARGILTDAEFSAKKAELLERM